nr:hypothetical protein GCM10025732_06000 [Glycomyces mayteni]
MRVEGDGYVKVGDMTGTDVVNNDVNGAVVNTRLTAQGAGYDSTPRIELTTRQPEASVGPASPIDFDAAFAQLRANANDLYVCEAHEIEMHTPDGTAVPKGGVAPGTRSASHWSPVSPTSSM